jgi:hypothetical protein
LNMASPNKEVVKNMQYQLPPQPPAGYGNAPVVYPG